MCGRGGEQYLTSESLDLSILPPEATHMNRISNIFLKRFRIGEGNSTILEWRGYSRERQRSSGV